MICPSRLGPFPVRSPGRLPSYFALPAPDLPRFVCLLWGALLHSQPANDLFGESQLGRNGGELSSATIREANSLLTSPL